MTVIILGAIVSVILIGLSISVHRPTVIVLTLLVNLLTGIQYGLLGVYASCAMTMISLIFVMVVSAGDYFPFARSRGHVVVGSLSLIICHGVLSDSFVSVELIALVASILGLLPVVIVDQLSMKIIQALGCALWLMFSVVVGAYGQVPGQLVTLIITVIAARYVFVYRIKHNVEVVPEMMTTLRRWFDTVQVVV